VHRPTRYTSFGTLVVTAFLLVAGCSSGGGKQSAPTTAHASTKTTVGLATGEPGSGTGPTGAAYAVVNLGKCPSMDPPYSPSRYPARSAAFNAGVVGLGKNLVPLDSSSVRVCRYGSNHDGPYEGGSVLSGSVASQFEDEVNHLVAKPLDKTTDVSGCVGGPSYYVTFAHDNTRVSLWGAACAYLTNGVLDAEQTTNWLNDLRRYTGLALAGPSGAVG
jgi:hypothetical protein